MVVVVGTASGAAALAAAATAAAAAVGGSVNAENTTEPLTAWQCISKFVRDRFAVLAKDTPSNIKPQQRSPVY
jgi:hypothetical protein